MKKHFLLFLTGALALGFLSCNDKNDQFDDVGKVTAVSLEGPTTAFMGDSLTFNFAIEGKELTLNTSRLQMVFDGEIVSERVMITNENGSYTGKIFVPFLKDVSDGPVKVKMRIQNERFKFDTVERDLTITRPEFPYLTMHAMVAEEPGGTDLVEKEFRMLPVAGQKHVYSSGEQVYNVSDLKAYIVAPAYGENGNEVTFGAIDGKINQGITAPIEFTSDFEEFEVTFDTQKYVGTPFIYLRMLLNGEELEFDETNDSEPKLETTLSPGMTIEITGLKKEYENYWVNPAFFYYKKDSDKKVFVFRAMEGKYSFTINKTLKYFDIRPLDQPTFNGTEGSIWVLGNAGVGIPSYATNNVNWSTNKAFPTARLEAKKHLVVLQAGRNINPSSINYKFFGQAGWGYEFIPERITIADGSTWFVVNAGSSDNGNIKAGSTSLTKDKYYYIYLDHTNGLPTQMTVEVRDDVEEVD